MSQRRVKLTLLPTGDQVPWHEGVGDASVTLDGGKMPLRWEWRERTDYDEPPRGEHPEIPWFLFAAVPIKDGDGNTLVAAVWRRALLNPPPDPEEDE